MGELTAYESRLLEVLRRMGEERGNPFAAGDEEIARSSGFLLTSGVNRLLRAPEARGEIRRAEKRPRRIEVLGGPGRPVSRP
jgi:SOS-response transcriptional repressor LexA